MNENLNVWLGLYNKGTITAAAPEPGITLAQLNAPASTVELLEVQQANSTTDDVDLGYADESNSEVTDGCYDSAPWEAGYIATGPTLGGRAAGACGNFYTTDGVHTSGSNFLACDGHVKWLRGSNVSNGYTVVSTGTASAQNGGFAATTSDMYLSSNSTGPVTLTFSTY